MSSGLTNYFCRTIIKGMKKDRAKKKNGRKKNPGRPPGDRPAMERRSVRLPVDGWTELEHKAKLESKSVSEIIRERILPIKQ